MISSLWAIAASMAWRGKLAVVSSCLSISCVSTSRLRIWNSQRPVVGIRPRLRLLNSIAVFLASQDGSLAAFPFCGVSCEGEAATCGSKKMA